MYVNTAKQKMLAGQPATFVYGIQYYRGVRQETGGDGKAPTVFIADPVAGKHFVLAPGSKKAPSSATSASSRRRPTSRTGSRSSRSRRSRPVRSSTRR